MRHAPQAVGHELQRPALVSRSRRQPQVHRQRVSDRAHEHRAERGLCRSDARRQRRCAGGRRLSGEPRLGQSSQRAHAGSRRLDIHSARCPRHRFGAPAGGGMDRHIVSAARAGARDPAPKERRHHGNRPARRRRASLRLSSLGRGPRGALLVSRGRHSQSGGVPGNARHHGAEFTFYGAGRRAGFGDRLVGQQGAGPAAHPRARGHQRKARQGRSDRAHRHGPAAR